MGQRCTITGTDCGGEAKSAAASRVSSRRAIRRASEAQGVVVLGSVLRFVKIVEGDFCMSHSLSIYYVARFLVFCGVIIIIIFFGG